MVFGKPLGFGRLIDRCFRLDLFLLDQRKSVLVPTRVDSGVQTDLVPWKRGSIEVQRLSWIAVVFDLGIGNLDA